MIRDTIVQHNQNVEVRDVLVEFMVHGLQWDYVGRGGREGGRTLGSRDTTLVSTSTLLAYQGKHVSLPPERSPHGMTVDMF